MERGLPRGEATRRAFGWTTCPAAPANDLTALFNGDIQTQFNVVRSDYGVALAQYNRTPGAGRLRMVFLTKDNGTYSGQREWWYATLTEGAAGVLTNEYGTYRAVPIAPLGSNSVSAGGLAPGPAGYPLFRFWANYTDAPKLNQDHTYSD